jgi:hypothetical protein
MNGRFLLGAWLMASSVFGARASTSGEDVFWQWFQKNEGRLFSFEKNQEAIFDEIGVRMRRVNPELTFEFGPVHNGKREFVISAGGIKPAFPAVEALYKKAPALPRWVWIKFRPRRDHINDINFGGKSIKADNVHYLLAEDGSKIGIVLFFDGYKEREKGTYGQIGYLFLDEALGEYAVETQVGFIQFEPRTSSYFKDAMPLRELPRHFDEQVNGRPH